MKSNTNHSQIEKKEWWVKDKSTPHLEGICSLVRLKSTERLECHFNLAHLPSELSVKPAFKATYIAFHTYNRKEAVKAQSGMCET